MVFSGVRAHGQSAEHKLKVFDNIFLFQGLQFLKLVQKLWQRQEIMQSTYTSQK